MSVSNTASANPKQFYQNQPGTSAAIIYTAPSLTSAVTVDSATAYLQEIWIANTTASAANISLYMGGSSAANALMVNLSIAANDCKIFSGLETRIPAGAALYAQQGTAGAITLTLSGVEVK